MRDSQNHNFNNIPEPGVLLASSSPQLTRPVLEMLARKAILGTVSVTAGEAMDFIDKNDYRLVIIDSEVDSRNAFVAGKCEAAFELLSKIRSGRPELAVIMVEMQPRQNAAESVALAVKAIRAGCYDFLSYPVNYKALEKIIDACIPVQREHCVASVGSEGGNIWKIIGKSPLLIQTVNLACRVAPTSAPVLITGESGTGKELISYIIHYNSRRTEGPFVKVNCAALSETLLESELFGHEKGAFTGAYTQRKGRFEAAHGGTLLLDEISETPLRFQAKLLRVLEGQDFQRVGSNENISVDVRIISTTNKDLAEEAAQGRFRQDLYYRLGAVRLQVPPLRQRKEDIPDLVWHFIRQYAGQTHRCITHLDPAMLEIFNKYHWPGNIRQLRNVVLTSLVLGTGQTLSLADVSWLFDELQPKPEINVKTSMDTEQVIENSSFAFCQQTSDSFKGVSLEQLEREHILDTLRHTNGNQSRAAKVLGISDRTLREKIRKFRQQGCLQTV